MPIVPFSAAGGRGELLERGREVATLRSGLSRACAGDGTVLLIQGPPGLGKTALLREAHHQAGQAHLTPLAARASELEQPFAFGVVRQLLEPVVRNEPGDRTELFTRGAALAARLFEADEQPPPSTAVGFEALHSLYWLVANLAGRGPLLVSVDDCQWADRDSLRFLAYLAQRIDGLPVTLLLAGRPADPPATATTTISASTSTSTSTETAHLWAQLAANPQAIAISPQPLSVPATVAWTRDQLSPEADEEFCRACHNATGGNPLFLRELLRTLDAEGVLPSAAAATEVGTVGPAAVRRFVLYRLAALGTEAGELARAVAVLGDDCDLTLAAQVAGISPDRARAPADGLVRAGLFSDHERLGFVHPIVRAALYDDLAPGERQARHAAAASTLAGQGAPAERVTAHLLLTTPTGDPQRVGTLRSAAASAIRRGAPRTAAARLQRALAESPPEQERAEILTDLGRCELATMQFEAAENHLRAVLAAGRHGTPTDPGNNGPATRAGLGTHAGPATHAGLGTPAGLGTRADAASLLGRCAIASGGRSARAAAAALAGLAAELRPREPDRSLQLGAELLMVTTAVPELRGDLDNRLVAYGAQARGHPGYAAIARIVRAQERLLRGGPAGPAVAEVQAALSTELPPGVQTDAVLLALMTLLLGEQYDLASQLLDVALDRARRAGHATREGLILGQRAAIALAQGSLRSAQVEAETGLLLAGGQHFAVLQLIAVAVTAHVEHGALGEAEDLASQVAPATIEEDHIYVPRFLVARGQLRIAQGRPEEGVADLLWCGRRLEAVGLSWPGDWRAAAAPALAGLGQHELATELAQGQVALARRVGAPGALGLALRAAAHTARETGARGSLLREAVAVLERSGARLELAHALADLGTYLSRANQRAAGRNALRQAIKLAVGCGAGALAERALAELHAGPGRRARAELTGPGALTAAEWRVCREAAEGRTNRELAQALFVTEKTIERHLSSAYAKLGIRSRFQLAAAIGE